MKIFRKFVLKQDTNFEFFIVGAEPPYASYWPIFA